MSKLYTVIRVGFEYNDEYNVRDDNEYGKVVMAYKKREKAEAEAKEQNDIAFQVQSPDGYDVLTSGIFAELQNEYPVLRAIDRYALRREWSKLEPSLRKAIWRSTACADFFFTVAEIDVEDD